MAKAKPAVQYACTECGYSAGRWFGKCPGCNAFGTLVEEAPLAATGGAAPKPILRLVDVEAEEADRIPTGVDELDRVLGGGLVPAALVLLGRPGARGRGPAPARGQGSRRRDDPRRSRDEGRLGRGPAGARAPGRLRAPVRGRPLPRAPDPASGQESLRLDQRARRLRDDGDGARRRPRPFGAVRPDGRG